MQTEGWSDLAKLNWTSLITAAAKDMSFHIASGLGESWLFPEASQGDISGSVKGPDQVRAYLYARNALIELHKTVAKVVDLNQPGDGPIHAAAEAYRTLDAVLRDNVITPPAFAGNVTPFREPSAKPDRWTAVAAYQLALETMAKELLKRHGPKGVMQLGSVDD